MASLSTVYMISLVLGSLASIGSAFVGTYVYPLQVGGTVSELTEAVKETASTVNEKITEATTPAPKPLKTEVETQPEVTQEAPVAETPSAEPAPAPEASETPVGGKKLPVWFKHSSRKH
jgi:hypothetical protein